MPAHLGLAEEGQRRWGCSEPSAYHTGSFLLEGILVIWDAFEKRVGPCLGLDVILDFLPCLGNLQDDKTWSQLLLVSQNP